MCEPGRGRVLLRSSTPSCSSAWCTSTAVIEPIIADNTDLSEIDGESEATLMSRHIVAYRLDGALFFGAAQRFLGELTAITDVRVVILRLPQLRVLDATGAQALGQIVEQLERRGITVLL